MAAETTHDRVDVLDGLRGLAIGLVVLFHVWQLSWLDFGELTWLPRVGFVGVEIFFVLSGFCIAYPFFAGKSLPWPEFYRRRLLKILPSYLLALFVAALFFDDGTVRSKPVLHLLTHFTFTQNWFFETYYSTLGPAWSLAVEVQFYLLFPLLWPLLRRQPVLSVLALALISALWRRWAWDVSEANGSLYTMRINQLPGCLDLFGWGMLAAWGAGRAKGASKWRGWASGACLLALIALFWLLRTHDDATFQKLGTPLWQARWRLAIGALVALVAVAGSVSIRPVQLALANPILRFLGFVSYNLYLWHKVLADALFHARWPAPATKDPHDDPRWQLLFTLVAVGLSILVAAATTWGLEQPILRWGKRGRVRYNEGS